MKERKRILVCPLDWGLGHATRCIPIIRELLCLGAEVIIAADKRPLALLTREFPSLEAVRLPGYDISYPTGSSMALSMLMQMPRILSRIKAEHAALEQIITTHKIDAVISDNRYGLWTPKVPCVFITHQVMVKMPRMFRLFEPLTFYITSSFVRRYTECWIPDFEGEPDLSGDLSHKYRLPAKKTSYIGPLSRFGRKGKSHEIKYKLLVILSGPEPQRTLLEDALLKQLPGAGLTALIVRGMPGESLPAGPYPDVTMVSHLGSEAMEEAIMSSELIISRPGYSTIMDLCRLGKRAIFIPTPGQTEQEYLAAEYLKKGAFYSEAQAEFSLRRALARSGEYRGISFGDTDHAAKKIRDFYSSL